MDEEKGARVIAVINQKGGVGKTTTAGAVAAGINALGGKALAVDIDPQANLTSSYGASENGLTVSDLLTASEPVRLGDVVQATDQGDIIAGGEVLAEAAERVTGAGKEYRLRNALEPLRAAYSAIVIDTPPGLGILTINALTASTSVLIAAQADAYSMEGIGRLYRTIEAVRQFSNPSLDVAGILLTRYTPRVVLNRNVAEEMEKAAERVGTKVFRARIRECVAVREAQMMKRSIFDYAPRSNAALDYMALVGELMGRGGI